MLFGCQHGKARTTWKRGKKSDVMIVFPHDPRRRFDIRDDPAVDTLFRVHEKRDPIKRKRPALLRGVLQKPGDVLLSRAVTSTVPSALKGLTAVFGMGTGVSPSLSSPEKS